MPKGTTHLKRADIIRAANVANAAKSSKSTVVDSNADDIYCVINKVCGNGRFDIIYLATEEKTVVNINIRNARRVRVQVGDIVKLNMCNEVERKYLADSKELNEILRSLGSLKRKITSDEVSAIMASPDSPDEELSLEDI